MYTYGALIEGETRMQFPTVQDARRHRNVLYGFRNAVITEGSPEYLAMYLPTLSFKLEGSLLVIKPKSLPPEEYRQRLRFEWDQRIKAASA
jgi:hypothetical protein